MRTKTKSRKVSAVKKPERQYEWYKTLAENYHLPTSELIAMLPSVNVSTLRRYKNYLWHYEKGNFSLTVSMPNELKKAYLNTRHTKTNKSKKVTKTWNIEYSYTNKEGTFTTLKEYKSKRSVLSAVTKALKDRSFKDFQITYKEN